MLGVTLSSFTSILDSIEHNGRTEKKISVSDIAEVSAFTNIVQHEKPKNTDRGLEHPVVLPQLPKPEMLESAVQTSHQLESERKPHSIGTHENKEPRVVAKDRVSSLADEARVQITEGLTTSGVQESDIDCDIAELQWRTKMWKGLDVKGSKRVRISNALSRLRSTTAWQKATSLDKIRMNELEIGRMSKFVGRSPSDLSKHFNGASLCETNSKRKRRRLSRSAEDNAHSASQEERESNSQAYDNEESFALQEVRDTPSDLDETCPLSRKRKSGARFVTGLLRDFTKPLEMATDVYGDISTCGGAAINAGFK